jgi:hypothetical protein
MCGQNIILRNDSKMELVATPFTQTGLRIAQKLDYQFISEYIS